MSAIATIAISDAQATPVVHNFVAARQGLQGAFNSLAEYEDRSIGIPVGFNRLTLTWSRPQPQRRSYRLNVKMELPILEVVSNSTVSGIAPAPTVAYKTMAQADLVIPERASVQARKDLIKMFRASLADVQVAKIVEDLDFPI